MALRCTSTVRYSVQRGQNPQAVGLMLRRLPGGWPGAASRLFNANRAALRCDSELAVHALKPRIRTLPSEAGWRTDGSWA